MYSAKYLEVNVDVNLCSTGLASPFEQVSNDVTIIATLISSALISSVNSI
jgi:hypothetical protein